MTTGAGSGDLGTLWAHIGLDTRMLTAGAAKAKTTLMGLQRGMGRIVGSMQGQLAAFATVAGGGILAASIVKTGAKFQQTMATVGGVMRATDEQMQALTASARRMGETTEWTASQAAESLKFLGMAGFEASKAIKALPGTLDLATAGNIDLGRAADIATNALTAMQLPVEELTRVNDVFIGTITRSNTNMEMMAETFKYAAPIANAFGYSIEELSGMIGMLGNAGIQASSAGTQLAMAIQKAADVAEKFGWESSELLDVLERLNKEGATGQDIMRLFGLRAGRAALVLRDLVEPTREFQNLLVTVNGESKKLADVMRDTVIGRFKEFQSVIESVKIDIFDRYADKIKSGLMRATKWVRDHRDQIIDTVDRIVAIFVAGWLIVYESWFKPFFKNTSKMQSDLRILAISTERFMLRIKQATVTLQASFEATFAQLRAVFEAKRGDWAAALEQQAKALNAIFEAGSKGKTLERQIEALNMAIRVLSGEELHVSREELEAILDVLERFPEIKPIDKAALEMSADIAKAVRAALEALHAGLKSPDDIEEEIRKYQELVDTRVDLLHELVQQEGISAKERLNYWYRLMAAVKDQMAIDREYLEELGMNAKEIEMIMSKRWRDLMEEGEDIFDAYGARLEEWAQRTAMLIRDAFAEFFFAAMKGDWESLTDNLRAIWDTFLRWIAQRTANDLMRVFDNIAKSIEPSGGWLSLIGLSKGPKGMPDFGFPEIPKGIPFQAGGVVTRPTLGLVGESGPEAVIPLHRLNDPNFWDRFGTGTDGPGRGDIHVHQYIQTPDPPSFKASQSQIYARASTAMRIAERRNN